MVAGSNPARSTRKNKMPTLKELVAGDKQVKFVAYRKGNLHYETDCGFEFIVPIEDCDDGVFLNVDRAMFFMRYIRKQLEANKAGLEG